MTKGTLDPHEPHPAASIALDYIRTIPYSELFKIQEALCSCAIEGNRLGEVCGETLRRLLYSEPVSDRYLLGLAWFLFTIFEQSDWRKKVKEVLETKVMTTL